MIRSIHEDKQDDQLSVATELGQSEYLGQMGGLPGQGQKSRLTQFIILSNIAD